MGGHQHQKTFARLLSYVLIRYKKSSIWRITHHFRILAMEYAMKAMVYHQYGSPDVLQLQEVEKPVPQGDEVLVAVAAAAVNWLDWHFLTGKPLMTRMMAGFFSPKNHVLGIDMSGRVEAVGANVTQFKPGDQVFGSPDHGCYAEYVCVSEANILRKPDNINFNQAAAVFGAGVTALHALRDFGEVQPGQKVLINGASGGVGTFAVQIARSLGAEVTGVCSTRNLELVRSIGADHVVDYTQEDFTRKGNRYDLIFDAVAKSSFPDCRRVLTEQGIFITSEFSPALLLQGQWISMTGNQKMVPLPPRPPNKVDQVFMLEQLEAGKLSPVIDRTYTLAQLPEALQYLENGHSRGKIVITMGAESG